MNLIVKTTDGCNAVCEYCSAYHATRTGQTRCIDLDLVRRLLDELESVLRDRPAERFTITWHGGEPLLLGPAFYEGVLAELSRRSNSFVERLSFSVQTNLVLMTDRLLAAFDGMGARIGSSIDPFWPTRRLRGRRDYVHEWLHAFERVRRDPTRRLGCVFVVHHKARQSAESLYRFFRNLGVDSVRFNPLYLEGRAREQEDLAIDPLDYGRFLIDLAEVWDGDHRRLRVLPVAEYVEDIHEARSRHRTCDNGGHCAYTHLSLSPDGTVSNCGRFCDSDVDRFGNVWRTPLLDMLDHPRRRLLANRGPYLRLTECRSCPWWRYCGGGCPNDAYLTHQDFMKPTSWCPSRRYFFEQRFGSAHVPEICTQGAA